jgi:outer membrane protein TolC
MNGQTVIATLCVAALLAPPGFAQQAPDLTEPQMPASGGWFSNLRRPYQARRLPPPNYTDSNRLDSLVRAGAIYLSLDDAIALALENNLDVEVGRYGPRIAEADLLRAEAGGFIRGIQTDVQQGPSSAGSLAGSQGGGIGVGGGGRSGGGIFGGIQIQQVGTSIPNLDPVLFFNTNWLHFTQPLTSTFTTATGSNSLVQAGRGTNYGIQKAFLSGTTVGYQWNNSFLSENSPYDDFNPWVNASMTLEVRQHLLSGFRPSVNSRLIRVAKNNIRVSDLVFKQQVITTVTAIVNLYWDLVAFNDNVRVKRQAVELAEKLYSDNKKQVAIGTLAPIEIVRAEAEVARTQQDLTNAETQVLEQETVLKNALSHHDVDDPLLSQARIVPTDSIRVPEHEQVIPIQDLYSTALQNRPEVEASEIGLENSRISIKGTKDALLPQLDLVADLRNNALAGQMNSLPIPPPPGSSPGTPFTTRSPSSVDPFFLGGWGRALTQLFSRNFPDYVVQVQLNIPLRNRSAQSDAIRDELLLRQQEINDRKTRKQVKVDVQNAAIALRQAFAAYQTAVKSRQLTDQTLQAERKRFTMGATTFLNVIQVQRDMTAARLVEVTAQNSYIRAQVLLEQSTGEILGNHKVILDEAKQGLVSRPPGAIPVLDVPNGRTNRN